VEGEWLASFCLALTGWGRTMLGIAGLLFLDAGMLRERNPRFGDFVALRDRLDPERLFRNAYLDRVLGG
jgi:hypothetical protein